MSDINIECFTFIVERDISKQDFVRLLDKLGEVFTELYNEEYTFSPVRRSEGGIVFDKYSEENNSWKEMRMYMSDKDYGTISMFEWIDDNTKESWRNDTTVLIPKYRTLHTFIKSLHGSPGWSHDEISTFGYCFQMFGINIKSRPKKKYLRGIAKLDNRDKDYYVNLYYRQ